VTLVVVTSFPAKARSQDSENRPSLTDLRHQTSRLLRYHATRKNSPARNQAVVALCDLYVVLRSDSRYDGSRMLQGDAAKLRRRLIDVARRREAVLQRNRVPKPANLSATVDQALQQAKAQADDDDSDRPLSDMPRGFGGAAGDVGWQLVELIQRVISPDFWDRQGGPGAIYYFAMRRVLVVRATTDVHQDVKDLLQALR